MLTQAQLDMRRSGITATDIVAIAGFSRWMTDLEVYEQKLGAPPKPMNLAMQMGHAAEPVVVDALAREYDLRLAPGETTRHNIMPWVLATPDRFVLDERDVRCAVVECKLVGWRQVPDWLDADGVAVFPDSVAIQAMWQMGTTAQRRCFVGALLGGWSDDDFHHTIVEFNESIWWNLLELAERFWKDHVEPKRPPKPDDSARATETLQRLYPSIRRREIVAATPEVEELMVRYREAGEREKNAEAEKREAGNALRALIADAEGVRGDELKAVWGESRGRVSVERIAEHYKLSVEDIEKNCRGDASRTLRVAPLTKKEKAHAA